VSDETPFPRISGYTVVRRLGKGETLLAKDPSGPPVTLTRLPDLAAWPVPKEYAGWSQEMLAEVRWRLYLRVKSESDHLVPLLGLQESDNGERYLEAQFVPGEDLSAVVRRAPLPAELALEVCHQAAQGLAVLHGRGLVHGDVKPANLVMAPDPPLRIWLIDPPPVTIFTGGAQWTADYVAPALARDGGPTPGGAMPTPATDLYSLGCTLFELLSGRVPYPLANIEAVLRAHMRRKPPLHVLRDRGLPESVVEAVAGLMGLEQADDRTTRMWVARLAELAEMASPSYAPPAGGADPGVDRPSMGSPDTPAADRPDWAASTMAGFEAVEHDHGAEPDDAAFQKALPEPPAEPAVSRARSAEEAGLADAAPATFYGAPALPSLREELAYRVEDMRKRLQRPFRRRHRKVAPAPAPADSEPVPESGGERTSHPAVAKPGEDVVDCSVWAPATVACGDTSFVQVFAHLLADAEEVARMAIEFDAEAGRRATRRLELPVRRGARLTFELLMPGLRVDSNVESLIWHGNLGSVQFAVDVPDDFSRSMVVGSVRVSTGSVPLGQVKFKLAIEREAAGATVGEVGELARRYTQAFVSYASQDRPEVLKRLQMLKPFGIGFFQDFMQLDPGQRWERELYRKIDDCDLFLLFWSRHAKASVWVRKEAEYARARQGPDRTDPPDVLPVILEGPPSPEAWPGFDDIQFDDVMRYLIAATELGEP
jgi:serine/threonine protein kinase